MAAPRIASVILAFALGAAFASPAEACPTCAALDPSIAPPGTESLGSFAYRVGADLRIRSFEQSGTRVEERRVGISGSFSPTERLAVELRWQFAHQTLQAANLADLRRFSLADPYVGVRVIAFRSRRIAPDRMLSLRMGAMLPLGHSRENQRVAGAQDADLGIGTWGAVASLAYRFATDKHSLNLSTSLQVLGQELVGLANASWLYQMSDVAALDLGLAGQGPLVGYGATALLAHVGMWLRVGRGLIGTHIAVPVAGDLGAVFQLEVMVGG